MNELEPMREVHEWRHKIYEETKHLSRKERIARIKRNATKVVRQYGLKLRRVDKAA